MLIDFPLLGMCEDKQRLLGAFQWSHTGAARNVTDDIEAGFFATPYGAERRDRRGDILEPKLAEGGYCTGMP